MTYKKSHSNKYIIGVVLLLTLIISGCYAQQPTQEVEQDVQDEIVTFSVGPELVDCVGVGPQQCMIVNGNNFYDNIQGFEYQEGYTYELQVKKTIRENVPADASRFQYELVEVISKEAQIPSSCISWFDGCNTCIVEDGELTGCTLKACFELQPAECLAYEENSMEDSPAEIDAQEPIVACCMAMTAECLACTQGQSVEEFCAENTDVAGCETVGLVDCPEEDPLETREYQPVLADDGEVYSNWKVACNADTVLGYYPFDHELSIAARG